MLYALICPVGNYRVYIEWVDSCVSVSQKDTGRNGARDDQTLINGNIFISVNEQQGRVRLIITNAAYDSYDIFGGWTLQESKIDFRVSLSGFAIKRMHI